jgi:ADP-ribose pyrophosphatase YjhB (NUDIX family)
MEPREIFRHCPRCAAPRSGTGAPFRCAACGFLYFFNPCCAVAGFVLNGRDELLLLRRAKEPARGKLAVPGGFIDLGETAEDALRRETREEADVTLGKLTYLGSEVNSYLYQEVTYPVLDLFFTATVQDPEAARPLDGVDDLRWQRPEEVDAEEIAFPSIRKALAQFVDVRRKIGPAEK